MASHKGNYQITTALKTQPSNVQPPPTAYPYYTHDVTGCFNPLLRFSGSFTLRIPIKAETSTTGRLVVYYVRDDNEVVADSIEFEVKECTNNNVRFKIIPLTAVLKQLKLRLFKFTNLMSFAG